MINTPVKLWRRGKKIAVLIGKKGTIVLWTIIRVPPMNFANQAPYPVVIIRLDSDEVVIGQLVDWEQKDLKVGREVVAVMRRITHEDKENIIPYGIKFKPV